MIDLAILKEINLETTIIRGSQITEREIEILEKSSIVEERRITIEIMIITQINQGFKATTQDLALKMNQIPMSKMIRHQLGEILLTQIKWKTRL